MDRGLQEIVDGLSLSLGRPVLIDDADLRPLAYSSQFGELDRVRTESILGRLAPDEVRVALFAEGIRTAPGPVHIPARPEIGMRARVCVPLRRRRPPARLPVAVRGAAGQRRGVTPGARRGGRGRRAGRSRRRRPAAAAPARAGPRRRAAERRSRPGREAPSAALEAEHYLPLRPVRVWVAAPADAAGEEWSAEALDRLRARLAVKQALCADLDHRLVCVAGARGMAGAAVMEALGALTAPRALVGQGEAVDDLHEVATSYRRALAALRVAAHEESGTASWEALGVERVVTALPDSALEDLPDGLRKLLAGDPSLVRTLEAYLDHAGDVKRTAAALSLHRGGLYYRLRRIEEVAGVNLHDGEDRLLCHLALRLARLAQQTS